MSALPELRPEEEAKPYAKYYYREPAAPSPELAAALRDPKPMDPAKALPIQRRNDLLDPGYFEVETGYCVMPEAVPAGLFEHCISEYANLRVILPEIYREQGGMIP